MGIGLVKDGTDKYYAYSDDVVVARYNYKNEFEVSRISSIKNDANDKVVAVLDENVLIGICIIEKDGMENENKAAEPSSEAGFKTVEIKGKDAMSADATHGINLNATEAGNSEEVFFVEATDDAADVKVFVADAANYAKDKWTAYNTTNNESVADWGTFYLKAVVTSQDDTKSVEKVIKVVAVADEVVPELAKADSATAITTLTNPKSSDTDSGVITLANGTNCTVAELKAVLTLTGAKSDEIIVKKTGSLGGLVTANDDEKVVDGMKIVAISNETNVEYSWNITIAGT